MLRASAGAASPRRHAGRAADPARPSQPNDNRRAAGTSRRRHAHAGAARRARRVGSRKAPERPDASTIEALRRGRGGRCRCRRRSSACPRARPSTLTIANELDGAADACTACARAAAPPARRSTVPPGATRARRFASRPGRHLSLLGDDASARRCRFASWAARSSSIRPAPTPVARPRVRHHRVVGADARATSREVMTADVAGEVVHRQAADAWPSW